MYKPAPTSNPTVRALEAFSTALGIIICAKKTSHIQELLRFSSPSLPCRSSSSQKLFLAVKHVLFCGALRVQQFRTPPEHLLLGTNGLDVRIKRWRLRTTTLFSVISGIGWTRWRTRRKLGQNGKASSPSWKRQRERSYSSGGPEETYYQYYQQVLTYPL